MFEKYKEQDKKFKEDISVHQKEFDLEKRTLKKKYKQDIAEINS